MRSTEWMVGITLIVGIGLFLLGYKLVTTAGVDRDLAEKHLGSGAVCGDTHNDVARCTRGGQLFVCTIHDDRVGCAEGDAPLPEGK